MPAPRRKEPRSELKVEAGTNISPMIKIKKNTSRSESSASIGDVMSPARLKRANPRKE
jgi:hypothetical protein